MIMTTKFLKAAFTLLLSFVITSAFSQVDTAVVKQPDPAKKIHVVKVACGQCKLGLSGHGCDLAVRFNGKAYFVEGTDINGHGDAHADDGFCNAVREAKVQGEVVNGKFLVTYFELLPEKKKGKK